LPDKPDLDPFWRKLDLLRVKIDLQTINVGENRREFDSQTVNHGEKRREIDPSTLDVGETWREFDRLKVKFPPESAEIEPQIVHFLGFRAIFAG
jgi:hypothetical protein